MARKRKEPEADLFVKLCEKQLGIKPVRELMFHPTRRWRFDYAIPELKIAIEIDGAVWKYGRHNRATGYIGDLEKFNEAASMGWLILKFITEQQYLSSTFDIIAKTIAWRKENKDVSLPE